MAELRLSDDGGTVVVAMSALENLGTLHPDVLIPRDAITSVRRVERAIDEVRGIRAPGTGIPRIIAAGTFRFRGGRMFAVCHRTGPGVLIELRGHKFDRVVLTLDDPDAAVALLTGS